VVEPGLLSSYFTSEASGPLVVGAHVKWMFPDGGGEVVDVEAVETNRRVVFTWKGTRMTIALEPLEPSRTRVTIEGASEDGALWQRMLLGLKARMAFGVDLRD
jgi:uncharacterized protein YndB with AHSA1/START domain